MTAELDSAVLNAGRKVCLTPGREDCFVDMLRTGSPQSKRVGDGERVTTPPCLLNIDTTPPWLLNIGVLRDTAGILGFYIRGKSKIWKEMLLSQHPRVLRIFMRFLRWVLYCWKSFNKKTSEILCDCTMHSIKPSFAGASHFFRCILWGHRWACWQ